MNISRAYHQVLLDIYTGAGSSRICYILIPEGVSEEVSKWAEKASEKHECNMVLISGMDWNHDMSPWMAEGVMKKEKKFTGGAQMFLSSLLTDFIPYVEQLIKVKASRRLLAGVSLSGLFSIWCTSRTEIFSGVASISGSLWFDNFTEWLRKSTVCPGTEFYLSLGSREKNTSDKRMMQVEDRTRETVSILEEKGLRTMFEMVQGTHFSPLAPRLEKAVSYLLRIPEDISVPEGLL